MIQVATADLRVMLADHMAFLRSQLSPMCVNNAEIERAIASLPDKIAERSPFDDVDDLRRTVGREARNVLRLLDLDAQTIRTSGTA